MGLCRVGWAMVLGLAVGGVASAADAPLVRKAPLLAPAYDWSGFYAGGHVGYGRGSTSSVLSDPASPDGASTFGSLYGGLQAGYNFVSPSGYFVGVEGDISFPEFFEDGAMAQRPTVSGTAVIDRLDYVATLRARAGTLFGNTLFYGTGGLATALTRFVEDPGIVRPQDKVLRQRFGWTAGAGAEFALAPDWTARIEYLYDRLDWHVRPLPSGAAVRSSFDLAHPAARHQPFHARGRSRAASPPSRGGARAPGRSRRSTGMCMASSR